MKDKESSQNHFEATNKVCTTRHANENCKGFSETCLKSDDFVTVNIKKLSNIVDKKILKTFYRCNNSC